MGSLLDTPPFALLFPPLPRPHEHELGRLEGAGDGEAPWLHSMSFGVGPGPRSAPAFSGASSFPGTGGKEGQPFSLPLTGLRGLPHGNHPQKSEWRRALVFNAFLLWEPPAGVSFFLCSKEPSSLEGHSMRGSLSPSVASTPLEATTGHLEEAGMPATASQQPSGAQHKEQIAGDSDLSPIQTSPIPGSPWLRPHSGPVSLGTCCWPRSQSPREN